MASLKNLEATILRVERVRVAVTGKTPELAHYWARAFSPTGTVADFRARFEKRYPGMAIEVYDGVGMPASGQRQFKSLRATYDPSWIAKEYAQLLAICHEIFSDQKREIKALKKALRKSPKAARVKEAELDPYEVLNVAPGASEQEIDLAHRDRIAAFQAERFEKFGDSFARFMTGKAQQIDAARDALARRRGKTEAG